MSRSAKFHSEAREFKKLADVKDIGPSLDGLTSIIQRFMRFPFENATKILAHKDPDPKKWQRRPDVLLSDHISFGAGGTCFSLTYFLQCILDEAGYDSYPVLCDRSYGPATHCALVAQLNSKRFLVDPGYLLGKPFELPQHGSTKGKMVELLRLADTSQFALITKNENGAKLRYRFKNIDASAEAFEKAWMDSFSFAMMRHLSLGRATKNGFTFARDMKIKSGKKEDGQLTIKKLSDEFGIDEQILSEAILCTNPKTYL